MWPSMAPMTTSTRVPPLSSPSCNRAHLFLLGRSYPAFIVVKPNGVVPVGGELEL